MAEKVGGDLGLIVAFDPLRQPPSRGGAFRYLRPGGARVGTMSVDDLATIRRSFDEAPSYLVFSHREAFRDAERILEAVNSVSRGRR